MRIVYFGTPEFAVPSLTRLIDSRHAVVALVSQPDRPKGRGQHVHATATKAVAVERGIPVLQPERPKDPQFLAQLAAFEPDLGVVAAYGRILPDVLLAVPRLGMINVHGSILPAYRGAAPVHRAVIAGERETGVTIMRVISELDAGPTFAMRRRPIGPDETSAEVEQAVSKLGAELLLEVIDEIAEGRAVETPQDDARATFAPKLTRAEGTIDWNQSADSIHNLVRGLQPWPVASARLGDARLLIHRTERVPPEKVAGTFPEKVPATHSRGATFPAEVPATIPAEVPGTSPEKVPATFSGGGDSLSMRSAAAGTIAAVGPDRFLVVCGDRDLLGILEIQPEGRRVMSVRAFLAGHLITPGARFETP